MNSRLSFGRKAAMSVSLLFSLLIPNGMKAVNLDGTWIHHPAATFRSDAKESQIDRIIEGEKYVYFCVRGSILNRSVLRLHTTLNNLDPIQIFRYDKTAPWENSSIRPLIQEFQLSGVSPNVINYSPGAGVLVVVDENNSVDFIYDDGTHVTSKALLNAALPLQRINPFSVSFDDEKPVVYIAGSFGYAVVNRITGELEAFVNTDKAVSWAIRVGENMVLFAGDITLPKYFATSFDSGVTVKPVYSTRTYIVPLPSTGELTLDTPMAGGDDLQAAMPLTDNSFAAVAITGETLKSVNLYDLSETTPTVKILADDIKVDNGTSWQYRHKFHTDGYFQEGKDGHIVHTSNGLLYIHKDGSLETISKEGLAYDYERDAKSGSLDGSKIWIYTYDSDGLNGTPRGFYCYTNDGASWTDKSEVAAPSAPVSAYANFVEWNPEHGFLLRGPGYYYDLQDGDIDRLSGYKDGIWTDLTYSANNPSYYFPTKSATNISTDPLNPNWIWGTSPKSGLHRMDLGDYTNFFELGSTNYASYKTTYPGFYPVFPYEDAYRIMIMLSNVDFDNDGTMWFARYSFASAEDFASEYVQTAKTPIYFLTAEERKAIATIKDNESLLPDVKAREIIVPNNNMNQNIGILAMKAEKNRNYLFLSPNFMDNFYSHALIYDHNGTPENKEDDRHVIIKGLYDENGEEISFQYYKGMYEDRTTGELWMLTTSGPFVLDPTGILEGNMTCRRPKITKRDGLDVDENPFEMVSITAISEDNLRRKWLATENGLYCLSADMKELLAHYNESNSPIPSNEVRSVGCSPEGTVMVLTANGIVEFHPEGSLAQVNERNQITIWPSSVSPDYNGYVTVSGVENGSEYVLVDAKGQIVKSLGTTVDNTLQWDLRSESGNRLPAGKYNIKRENKEEAHPVIIL